MKVRLLLPLVVLLLTVQVFAQAPTGTVTFDYPNVGSVPATVQAYTAMLYVNGIPFVVNDTCVAAPAPAVVTCSGALPDVSAALPPTGPNQFLIRMKDGILEGPASPPLTLTRPSATSTPRIQ